MRSLGDRHSRDMHEQPAPTSSEGRSGVKPSVARLTPPRVAPAPTAEEDPYCDNY